MDSRKINYIARDFEAVRGELVKFSKQYYPEVADDFNDSSIGAWFMDLVAAVGDELSYYIDRSYQETSLDSANIRSTVLNIAKNAGFRIPGAKASMCEVEVSCVVPTDASNISKPDWRYAPILQRTSIVSAGNYDFELSDDVNFAEQFNSDGYSNRRIVPTRNSNGNITGYTISKSVIAINGNTKVYKKVISASEVKPFMEIVLPDTNVMNIESIIFKDTSEYTVSPQIYEYYIDAEKFKVSSDAVDTYRFFECDSLADLYRFGTKTKINDQKVLSMYNPYAYVDYTETVSGSSATTRTTRYYKGEWQPLKQKFVTEYTDNGFMKIIFGASNEYDIVPENYTTYADYQASKLINNDMLGIMPREGWSMFVLYRTGGGSSTNLGPRAINRISLANVDWNNTTGTDSNTRGKVIASMKVTNMSSAVAGKDAPSTDEIKNLIKYNTSAQNRAVVVNDYKVKLAQMPPRYGCPFRSSVIETNNKIEMCLLGMNSMGRLDSALPQTLVENILAYMSHFKQINDYIEIKSGKIYNIGVAIDVFIDKNYNAANVVTNIINAVRAYFSIVAHDMGDEIFIGDLEKELTLLDGVISLIDLRIYKIWNGGYSPDKCPLPVYVEDDGCKTSSRVEFSVGNGAESEEIDLDACDMVMTSDYNSMFEILNDTDVVVKFKQR